MTTTTLTGPLLLAVVLASCGKPDEPTPEQARARMEFEAKVLASAYAVDARHDVGCDAPKSTLSLAVGEPIATSCAAAWSRHVMAVTTTMTLTLTREVASDADLGRRGKVTAMHAGATGCELRFQLLDAEVSAGFDFELVEDHGRVTGMMWYWDPGVPRSCGHGFHVTGERE